MFLFNKNVAATAAALLLAVGANTVKAGFECEKVWDGPSADNSLANCFADPDHLVQLIQDPVRIQYASGAAISMLILIICLLCCPLVTICRYVCRCFGSYRRRPGAFCGGSAWDEVDEATKQEAYDTRCRKAAIFAPWIILVACIAPMVLLLRGADTSKKAYNGVFDDVNQVAVFAENNLKGIRGNLTLDNGSYVFGIDGSYFDDAQSSITDFRNSLYKTRDDNAEYVDMAKTVAIVVGVVPILFFLFNALFSLFHVRKWLPCINSCFMLLLIIIYGLVACVLIIMALLLRDTCDEADLYNQGRKPGLFAWFIVPTCENTLPFESFKGTIDQVERDNSKKACDEFRNVCNPTKSTYDSTDAASSTERKRVFYCPTLQSGTTCTSFKNVTYHLNESAIRDINDPILQASNTKLCDVPNCTIFKCQNNCTDADVRERAKQTVTYIDFANRALDAFNLFVRPLLDCEVIVDVAVKALGSCSKVQDSTWLIGTGALLFECYAAVSLIVIWVGQKRWFDPDDKDKDNEPTKEMTTTRR